MVALRHSKLHEMKNGNNTYTHTRTRTRNRTRTRTHSHTRSRTFAACASEEVSRGTSRP